MCFTERIQCKSIHCKEEQAALLVNQLDLNNAVGVGGGNNSAGSVGREGVKNGERENITVDGGALSGEGVISTVGGEREKDVLSEEEMDTVSGEEVSDNVGQDAGSGGGEKDAVSGEEVSDNVGQDAGSGEEVSNNVGQDVGSGGGEKDAVSGEEVIDNVGQDAGSGGGEKDGSGEEVNNMGGEGAKDSAGVGGRWKEKRKNKILGTRRQGLRSQDTQALLEQLSAAEKII